MDDLSSLVARMRPHGPSVFGEFSALATRVGAVNLGQGFPDTDGPQVIKDVAIAAIQGHEANQYPPRNGRPELLAAVCEHQRRWYGLDYSPETDAVIGTGASELLPAALLALVDDGDEVIVADPWFDIYGAGIALARGVRVGVPLTREGRSFTLAAADVAAAVTPRTRVLLLNSPHNPTGTVLDRDTLTDLAAVVDRHDLLVISDEVYEHVVFPPAQHIPFAAIPGMRDRTVTIGSGGKTFSLTGWKVGWATGPAHLISAVRVVRQHLSYVSGGPFQPAITAGLHLGDDYFDGLSAQMKAGRDRLAAGLASVGLDVLDSDGSYFLVTDVTPLGWPDGESFVEHIIGAARVVAIPVQRLSEAGHGHTLVRWTFCKQPAVLDEALRRLASVDLRRPEA